MVLERGTLLHNRYRIIEILGQGGMGAIYRAVDENLGVEVAVKENLFTTEEYARQFHREATILAGMRHPNLPRVSDHFVIDGQGQYLVMDYIEGEDLRERLDRTGVISEEEALVIAIGLCDALSYMHDQNPPILHRDIKPGNVKITPDGSIFLVDFGLAKVGFSGHRTTTGARAMTPGYSPPEQYGGARTDQRSDIYSLGATLYAALAGAVPEDSLARTMGQEELTPLRRHNPAVSRRFARAIEKALEVHPDNRYQTAEEFKQALLEATDARRRQLAVGDAAPGGAPPSGKPPAGARVRSRTPGPIPVSAAVGNSRSGPPSKPGPMRRGCLIGLVLMLFLLVAGGGALYWLNPALGRDVLDSLAQVYPPLAAVLPSSSPTATEVVPLALESISTISVDTATGPVPSPLPTDTPTPMATVTTPPELSVTPSPMATWTPTVTFTDTATATLTFTVTATRTPRRTATPTITLSPTVTPHGGGYGQIAFASDRTGLPQIWVMNIDGSGLFQLTDVQLGACQPDWAPDGSRLVFVSPCRENQELYPGAGLFIINADGTDVQPLPVVGVGAFDPAWSPDGGKIVYSALREDGRPQLYLLDLASGESTLLSLGDFWDSQAEWSPDGEKIVFVTTRNGPYQIWHMSPDGSQQLRFSASGGLWDQYPIWSPDGQTIYFTQREQGGIPRLMGARYPDGGPAEFRLYPYPGTIPMREASVSPDGLWLAFESWEAGQQHDIFLLHAGEKELTLLTDDSGWEFDVDWRPAGP